MNYILKTKKTDREIWFKKIEYEAQKNNITIIQGLRRIGKSLIMNTIASSFAFEKYIKKEFDVKDFGVDPLKKAHKFINEFQGSNDKKYLLLIDEFQELPDWNNFFWTIHKLNNVKVIATGSVSANINGVNETEGGRYVYIQLPPLSFEEYEVINRSDLIGKSQEEKFNQYATTGSYPDQEFSENLINYRKQVMENVYEKIKHEALLKRAQINDSHNINKIMMYIIENLGNNININSMSNSLSINARTVEKIIKYLKATFLIYEINNSKMGKGKAATYNRKFYLVDHTFYLFGFQSDYLNLDRKYRGFLYENIIINQIRSKFDKYELEIRFLKSKEYDIDLVLIRNDNQKYFEIKDSKSIDSLTKKQKIFSENNLLNIIYRGKTQLIGNLQFINHIDFYKELEKWI